MIDSPASSAAAAAALSSAASAGFKLLDEILQAGAEGRKFGTSSN